MHMHFTWLEGKHKDTRDYVQRHVYTLQKKTCKESSVYSDNNGKHSSKEMLGLLAFNHEKK